MQQRAADGEHLLLAARERARLLAPPLGEPREIAEHALEVLPHRAPVGADIGAEAQVLLDRQIGEGAAPVGHMRDAEARDRLGRKAADRPAARAGRRPRGGSGRRAPCSVVVLPAPFAPSSAVTPPSSTAKSRPNSAWIGP